MLSMYNLFLTITPLINGFLLVTYETYNAPIYFIICVSLVEGCLIFYLMKLDSY